jgi:formate dehydrogenase subunit gamma
MTAQRTGGSDQSDDQWDRAAAAAMIAARRDEQGALLPILHDLQAAFGFVPAETTRMIAEALNLSRAEVHGVISFYHDFRAAPAGRHVLRLCRAEACQAMGGDRLAAYARERLGIGWHETTPGGGVTLEPVYCLGLCACGPSAMFDEEPIGRVDAAAIDALLEGAL